MILKIDIHRYTDNDASVLSLKEKTKQRKMQSAFFEKKNKAKERSFDLCNIL